VVTAPLKFGPWGAITGKARTDVVHSGMGMTMIRGTDIGPLIPHVGTPQYLLPVTILMSASKCEFGATSVMTPEGPIAVAVAAVVNFNLNCMGPTCPPLPLGLVPAVATEAAGFTLGDFLGGLAALVFDSALQYLINRAFGSAAVSGFFERVGARALGPLMQRLGTWGSSGSVGSWIATAAIARASTERGTQLGMLLGLGVVDQLLPSAVSLLVGGPLGADIGLIPTGSGGTTPIGALANPVTDAYNDPSVREHGGGSAAPPAGLDAAPSGSRPVE
jgi:hypothetical protein